MALAASPGRGAGQAQGTVRPHGGQLHSGPSVLIPGVSGVYTIQQTTFNIRPYNCLATEGSLFTFLEPVTLLSLTKFENQSGLLLISLKFSPFPGGDGGGLKPVTLKNKKRDSYPSRERGVGYP